MRRHRTFLVLSSFSSCHAETEVPFWYTCGQSCLSSDEQQHAMCYLSSQGLEKGFDYKKVLKAFKKGGPTY